MKRNFRNLRVNFAACHRVIDDVSSLKRIGAGHDGVVYFDGDYAIKIFKGDIDTLLKKDLMTYKKALLFSKMNLKRIISPIDVLLNDDGVYCGYPMKYIDCDSSKSMYDYSCDLLVNSIYDLQSDFANLSSRGLEAIDINMGSYLLDSSDFLYLCDVDKYKEVERDTVRDRNTSHLNYAIARFLGTQMFPDLVKDRNTYVKKSSNDRLYLNGIERQIAIGGYSSVGEYLDDARENLIKKR